MPNETSTFELIARVAFESNLDAAKETTSQLSKQDNLVNELTKHQQELGDQMKKANDPATIQKLNKEFEKSEKIITDQQKAIQDQIKKTTSTIQKAVDGIDFGKFKKIFTGEEFKALDEQISNAKTDMAQLAILTEALKGKLGTLDAGTAEFQELSAVIQVSEATLKEFASAQELVAGKSKPVKTQLRELRDQMNELELAGKENTAEFKALANQAGILQDQMDATSQRVKILASDTKNIDFGLEAIQSVTAAFEVGAGAAVLFGASEEDLAEAQAKLISLMAIANGLQQLQNALQKESTLRVVGAELATKALAATQAAYNVVVGTSTGALKAFRIALATTGIGALVVGIGLLVANWEELSKAISGSTEQQKMYNDLQKAAAESAAKEISRLKILKAVVEDSAISQAKRNAAVTELQKQFPVYFGNLDKEKIKNGEVAGAYDLATAAILRRAAASAAESKIAELVSQQLELERKKQVVIKKGLDAERAAQDEVSKKDQALIRTKEEVQKQIRANTVESVAGIITEKNELQKTIDFYTKYAKEGVEAPITPTVKKDAIKKSTDDINAQLDAAFSKSFIRSLFKDIREEEFIEAFEKAFDFTLPPLDIPLNVDIQNPEGINMLDVLSENEAILKARKDRINAEKELLRQQTIAVAEQARNLIQIEIDKSNQLIAVQEDRLARAEANQEDANDVNVKAERDRLDQLREEKARFVRQQRAIDAAIIAANQAVSISNAIRAITSGSTLGPAGVAANVLAIVAGLAAVGIAISQATSDIPEFYQGGYTGDGNPNATSNVLGPKPYIYHKGEFVFDHNKTAQYRDMFEGIHSNDMIVKQTAEGYAVIPKRLDVGAIANDRNNIKLFYNSGNQEVESRLASIERLLREKETTVNTTLDRKGFALSVEESINQIRLNDRLR